MEFKDQRGNPNDAWSVGKYAKRSATIHLCSQDAQHIQSNTFVAEVAAEDHAQKRLTITDKGGKIRAQFPGLENPKLFFNNKATGHRPAPQGGATLVGAGGGDYGDDFTILQVNQVNSGEYISYPRVRDEDSGAALYGLGTLANNVAFRMGKDGDDFYIMLKDTDLPVSANAEPHTAQLRLCKDAFTEYVPLEQSYADLSFSKQLAKGYRLQVLAWDKDNDADPNHALEFVATGLRLVGFEPIGTATYHKYLITGVVSKGLVDVYNLEAAANAQNAPEVSFNRAHLIGGDQNPRIYTWNMKPTTTVTATSHAFPSAQDNNCNYEVTIPNIVGYPEHKRCLIQVQSISACPIGHFFHGNNDANGGDAQTLPAYVGVELQGVGAQQNFSSHIGTSTTKRHDGKINNTDIVGYCNLTTFGEVPDVALERGGVLSYGYESHRSILDEGVLCNSPFGKRIRVRLFNLTSRSDLDTNSAMGFFDENGADPKFISENPTHVTLRLLFLDDDELPMR
eukprot:COSAG04_NODE_370_length_15729_cov_5.743506_5_plen_509_part_00